VTATTVEEFEAQRPSLMGLAYRMLGEVHEAEDAVQDAYLRWRTADRDRIEAPRAWLAKVVTNLCLNRLSSARARRETYPGPWLPEPVPTGARRSGAAGPAGAVASAGGVLTLGPLETVEQRDSISLALLTLMERLTPPERAVFVLREAFSHTHREIAEILGVTEAGSRRLHHRARQRLGEPRPRFETEPGQWHRLVERFLAAAADGDVAGLEVVLAADVTAWSDGGGRVSAARRPIIGRDRVARFILGLAAGQVAGDAAIEEVNCAPALIYRVEGVAVLVTAFEITDGRISALHMVLNPGKLAFAAEYLP
jgi:RNA polymerase sigma factor (sigma-70 family)